MTRSRQIPDPSVLWDVTHAVSGDLTHHTAAQDLHEVVAEMTEEAFEVEVDLRQAVFAALDRSVGLAVNRAVREESHHD